uniref:Uncharacterized protein n=1 Tax=Peronospora matthiolae TaxID=2874970 RepID=A0AAV1THB1_9STRA
MACRMFVGEPYDGKLMVEVVVAGLQQQQQQQLFKYRPTSAFYLLSKVKVVEHENSVKEMNAVSL